ncbi:DUF2182 domain-containing protein [Roseibium aggregatum]|uniref:DUF2182 domain-containing protein n=1 Tax=Roseibium aggregatum TaxID=187304 RepID=A0A939EDB0_9HYPH|nr:DUF2182 domain-containing protein [Roseibium aggregatum]MBN9670594.1 DUF2182 domain-containing protein [Roseibium aggregatum]
MTFLPSFEGTRKDRLESGKTGRGWPFVLMTVAVLCLTGWTYLVAMVADMVPVMDMTQAGPGMGILNQFNLFKGLSAEARAALAVICLPAGATFGMPGPDMGPADLFRIFAMWTMMALAMMLPSALPMLRAYSAETAGKGEGATLSSTVPVVMAVFGYLAVWVGYAVVATAVQWGLYRFGAMNDMMAPVSMALTTSVLFAAGLYQFTPAKQACLARCWYPRFVFAALQRSGAHAGFREGLVQGLACLGCCWAVMTVMFAVGLMNIIWIALLGGVMALEKSLPSRVLPAAIGVVLIVWAGLLTALIFFGSPAG